MKLREKLNAVLGKLFPNDVLLSYRVSPRVLSDAVDIMVREAVEAEREACAKAVLDACHDRIETAADATSFAMQEAVARGVEAIRARGNR